jgi:mRNA interferase RelE/StbE
VASCRVEWRRSAERDLLGIDRKQIPRIIAAVERLSLNPAPTGSRKLVGSGHLYRLRVGDYRVVYEFGAAAGTICIFYVRHRRDAYR